MTLVLEIVLLLAAPAVIGYCIVHLVTGRASLLDEALFKIPTGLALGVGITGATTFMGMLAMNSVNVLVELALASVLVWLVRRRARDAFAPSSDDRPRPRWAMSIFGAVLLSVIVTGALVWISRSIVEPHGSWDAWDFWNMRARFYVRAGDDWPRAHTQILQWAHPEYPPMLSASVARGFRLLGSETFAVPITLAAIFTIASPLLVGWTVRRLRGWAQGLLAAITLCATPYFVMHGADQYADAPLAFFFLCTFAFTALFDADGERPAFLALAGLAASLAALTKNEGMLFTLCFVVARSIVALRAGGRRRLGREAALFAAGALPVGVLVAIFKVGYATTPITGEFYVGRWMEWDRGPVEHVLYQLRSGERWIGFFESWYHHLTTFDQWWPYPLVFTLPVYMLIAGRSAERPRTTVRTILLTLAVQALGVSVIFMAWSTYDIREHMDALGRLLYHVLPSVILGVFLVVRSPFERERGRAAGAEEPEPA